MIETNEAWEGGSPWLFLLGFVLFLGSGLLFVADLIRGIDVLRSIAGNAVGAAVLIVWAARDTLSDPESEVATLTGAAGTALLLYALYLFLAGLVIAITGLAHERLHLGFWYGGLAFVALVVGFVIFPTETVVEGQADDADGRESTEDDGRVTE